MFENIAIKKANTPIKNQIVNVKMTISHIHAITTYTDSTLFTNVRLYNDFVFRHIWPLRNWC